MERSQRRASRLRASLSPARGRRQGGGERGKLGPKDGTPTKLQTGYQFLTKDFLRFWMVDIRQEGRIQKSAPQKGHKAHPTGARGNWGWDRGEEKVHHTGGKCTCQAPGCLSCSGREGTKLRPNRVCAFVEYPKTGTAGKAGPAPYRAAWSLSSVDRGSTHPWAGANPVWLEHCECSPHKPVTFVCSAPPSPQQHWTSEPKKETTFACLYQGGNKTLKRPANRSQINKGNRFRRDRCNRLKYL